MYHLGGVIMKRILKTIAALGVSLACLCGECVCNG